MRRVAMVDGSVVPSLAAASAGPESADGDRPARTVAHDQAEATLRRGFTMSADLGYRLTVLALDDDEALCSAATHAAVVRLSDNDDDDDRDRIGCQTPRPQVVGT